MATADGSKLVTTHGGKDQPVKCSRWSELGDSLTFHTDAAAHLLAPTEFRFINAPGNGAPQYYEVVLATGLREMWQRWRRW